MGASGISLSSDRFSRDFPHLNLKRKSGNYWNNSCILRFGTRSRQLLSSRNWWDSGTTSAWFPSPNAWTSCVFECCGAKVWWWCLFDASIQGLSGWEGLWFSYWCIVQISAILGHLLGNCQIEAKQWPLVLQLRCAMSDSELVMIIVQWFSFHEMDFLVAKDSLELSQSPPLVQYFRNSKSDLNLVLYIHKYNMQCRCKLCHSIECWRLVTFDCHVAPQEAGFRHRKRPGVVTWSADAYRWSQLKVCPVATRDSKSGDVLNGRNATPVDLRIFVEFCGFWHILRFEGPCNPNPEPTWGTAGSFPIIYPWSKQSWRCLPSFSASNRSLRVLVMLRQQHVLCFSSCCMGQQRLA